MKLWIILLSLIVSAMSTASLAKPTSESSYCLPQQPCWPKSAEWNQLNQQVNGHLIKGNTPLTPCYQNSNSKICHTVLENIKNPFFIESQPGLTQSSMDINQICPMRKLLLKRPKGQCK